MELGRDAAAAVLGDVPVPIQAYRDSGWLVVRVNETHAWLYGVLLVFFCAVLTASVSAPSTSQMLGRSLCVVEWWPIRNDAVVSASAVINANASSANARQRSRLPRHQ